MLKNRRILFLGIAVLLAIITVVITQQWLQRETNRAGAMAQAESRVSSVKVLVAARTLPPGTILKQEDLTWQPWPAEGSLEGYFTESASNPETLIGAVVKNELARGEPFTREGIAHPGDRSFLAAVLRPGYRAVSIAITASTGVSGFIRPGDRVDVLLSRVSTRSGAPSVVTRTILSNARVVGIDQRVSTDNQEVQVPQTATLEVTPTQAEAIAGATELGKLSLALRSLATSEGDSAEESVVSPFWRGNPAPRARRSSSAASPRPSGTRAQGVEVIRGETASGEGSGS